MIFLILLLIQLAIFGLLALLLRYVLTRHISGSTEHLQVLTEETTKKLEAAKKQLEEGDRYHKDMLKKATEEGDKLRQDLVKQGENAKDAMLREVRQQSEAITRQAQNAAHLLMQEIEEKIKAQAITQANELVQQLLRGEIAEETHAHWVDQLIKNGFDGLSRMNVAEDVKEVEIESPYPLSPDQKTLVQKKVREKVKHEVRFTEKIDPALIAGLRITLGNALIDGTIKFKIQEMVRHASRSVSK